MAGDGDKKRRKDVLKKDAFGDTRAGNLLTRAIIDTVREPLIVLDSSLRVLVASPSFYKAFMASPEDTEGKYLYKLGNGQWDIPGLRDRLSRVVPERTVMDEFEVTHTFPHIGMRTMILNSREIIYKNDEPKSLLTIYDVTSQRAQKEEREELIRQKDLLLKEMRHRIANSLQLIASVVLLKATNVDSEEARLHLNDAHERIMSIATVQRQLDPGGIGEEVPVAKYLVSLCDSVQRSMIGSRSPISVRVHATEGSVSSEIAISLGLLTTELVINSIKHAFPNGRSGIVTVSYRVTDPSGGWELSVSDNGVGMSGAAEKRDGLGTSIAAALARQLNAVCTSETGPAGTRFIYAHRGRKTEAHGRGAADAM